MKRILTILSVVFCISAFGKLPNSKFQYAADGEYHDLLMLPWVKEVVANGALTFQRPKCFVSQSVADRYKDVMLYNGILKIAAGNVVVSFAVMKIDAETLDKKELDIVLSASEKERSSPKFATRIPSLVGQKDVMEYGVETIDGNKAFWTTAKMERRIGSNVVYRGVQRIYFVPCNNGTNFFSITACVGVLGAEETPFSDFKAFLPIINRFLKDFSLSSPNSKSKIATTETTNKAKSKAKFGKPFIFAGYKIGGEVDDIDSYENALDSILESLNELRRKKGYKELTIEEYINTSPTPEITRRASTSLHKEFEVSEDEEFEGMRGFNKLTLTAIAGDVEPYSNAILTSLSLDTPQLERTRYLSVFNNYTRILEHKYKGKFKYYTSTTTKRRFLEDIGSTCLDERDEGDLDVEWKIKTGSMDCGDKGVSISVLGPPLSLPEIHINIHTSQE